MSQENLKKEKLGVYKLAVQSMEEQKKVLMDKKEPSIEER